MKMELNNFTDLEKISPLASSRTHGVVSERKVQAVGRAGQAVNMAVERFITIGELIADDNPEIKSDMYSFCRDARDAGKSIEHLCEISTIEDMDYLDLAKRSYGHTDIVIASRSLLSSITRVLLLVDIVVVKQLLTAKRKITKSLEKLESIMNFAEFVRAFSVFGLEMIELAYLTGNQQNRLKEERHRAQMFSARQMLEHSITILITSSRNSLVHGDCLIAKENRDTVFCQIRRAMDLIHFVIKDSIFDGAWFGNSSSAHHQPTLGFKNGENGTIFTTLKHLNYLMESLRQEYKISEKSICMANNNCNKLKSYNDKSWYNDCLHQRIPYQSRWDCGSRWLDAEALPLYNSELKEQLLLTFEKLLEKTHDFTDSAYTSHMYRENILLHCDRCKLEFNKYYNKTLKNHQYGGMGHIDTDIDCVLNAVKSLSKQLVLAVTNQANELLFSLNMSINLLDDFRAAAMQQDLKRLEEQSNRFHDYSDHIIDVCKLLQHIAFTETLQVQAKCLAMNLRIYGPQILTAVKILFKYPDSDAALENFDAFAKMWKWLTTEMNALAKQVIRTTNLGADGRPDAYNTSENFDVAPYAGKSSAANAGSATVPTATAAVANPTTATAADGTQAPNELSKFDELNPNDNNDILKRAKNMSAMAFSMYQFTKGSGTLKTTQDLFTQAEYFAEEANRLYKVLRQFSYQVPASPNKKDLLNILDRVPTFVQTLQFTVKDHTVGKAATFVKVDHVIKETKELMSVINKVVEKCFECANKFKLDFTGITGDIASCSSRGDDCNASGMGDSKGTTNSSEGSM